MTQYTPILIKFVPAVMLEADPAGTVNIEPLKLVIQAPNSKLDAAEQSLPLTSVITVPFDQELRLKLLPSSSYSPKGRYKVKVFQAKSREPIHTMTWIVPDPPKVRTTDVVSQGTVDELTFAAFEIISVSHNGEYRLEGSKLIWTTNPPPLNATYRVTFQPSVSLNELIAPHEI